MKMSLQVILLTVTRMVVSGSMRMVYPFLPVFARSLGVGIADISLGVTTRNFIGIAFPFFSSAANFKGSKIGMLLGIGITVLGCAAAAFYPGFITFFVFMVLAYIGMNIFVTSMLAYLGENVPYERRGTAVGITELGWSSAFILVVPAVGFLIDRFGWQSPLWALGVAAALAAVLVFLLVRPNIKGAGAGQEKGAFWRGFSQMLKSPIALAGLAVSLTVMAANETVNLVFGVWMEDAFLVKVAGLGLASAVIGAAEIAGDLITTFLVDRIGKMPSIRLGLVLNVIFTFALPAIGNSLWGAYAGLFLVYVSFKIAILGAIILLTEAVPSARATVMGANIAAYSLGRVAGSALAPTLYALGFVFNTTVAGFMILVGFGVFWLAGTRVHEANLYKNASE